MVSYVMATPTLNHKSSASGQRHAFAAAAKTSKISTESSALRRETLREDGGRVRLDAGELAEARPGDRRRALLDRRLVSASMRSVQVDRNGLCALQRSSLVFFMHRCCGK